MHVAYYLPVQNIATSPGVTLHGGYKCTGMNKKRFVSIPRYLAMNSLSRKASASSYCTVPCMAFFSRSQHAPKDNE